MDPSPVFNALSRFRSFSLLLTIVLALIGGGKAANIPITLYPSIDFPRVSVIVSAPDIPFREMESRVTRPVGIALRSVRGVRDLRSRTMQGSSEFFLRFSWSSPMRMALPRVGQALDRVRGSLPPGTRIRFLRMYPSDTPVLGLAFHGNGQSLSRLTEVARYRIIPFLSNLPGVWKADVVGAKTREVHVEVDPFKLAGVHRTMQEVVDALSFQNRIGVVGRVTQFHRMKTLEVNNILTSPEDVRRLFIPSSAGVPLPLREVATIKEGIRPADDWVRVTSDGVPSVLVQVFRAHGGNAITIRQELMKHWSELRHLLPSGVHLSIYYDQGELVLAAIRHVSIALLIGLLAALGIVLLFLRSMRPFLVMACLTPAIGLITLGVLDLLGQSINLMTLGGIAAGMGLVIDDFIVIVEGGRHRTRIVRLLKPFVISGFLTMIAIVPILGIGGLVGAFFMPLALSFVTILAVSLLVNTFVTPFYLKNMEGNQEESRSAWSDSLSRASPLFVAVLSFGIAILFGFSLRALSTNFMPRMDEGAFVLDFHAPPGSSLGDTDRIVRRVETKILSIPGVEATSRRLGTEMGFFITEPNKGDIVVRLSSDRKESIFSVMDRVRVWSHAHEPELETDFSQVLEDMLGDLIGVEAPIVVQLHGQDRELLMHWAQKAETLIQSVPGMVDVRLSVRPMAPALDVHVDRQRAALYGMTPDGVIRTLRTDLLGTRATTLLEHDIPLSVRVLYPPLYSRDRLGLERLPLETPGGLIPISQISTWKDSPLLFEEEDLNLSPVLMIKGRLEGRNLGKAIETIRSRLSSLPLPSSIWITYSGAYAQEKKSFRSLGKALIGGFLLVFTLLFGYFREWRSPTSIFLATVFSLLAGVSALVVTHRSLNISSFVGLILVLGITAENGFLVAARFNDSTGSFSERIRSALRDRFLPLLMTHFATLFALLPLAVGGGAGLDMERPLAIAVIGGLVGSFLSSTFLIPSLLALFYRRGDRVLSGGLPQ
ncbi:MAG: efflux RND transporter permease subunit [Leptospirales bacterium]